MCTAQRRRRRRGKIAALKRLPRRPVVRAAQPALLPQFFNVAQNISIIDRAESRAAFIKITTVSNKTRGTCELLVTRKKLGKSCPATDSQKAGSQCWTTARPSLNYIKYKILLRIHVSLPGDILESARERHRHSPPPLKLVVLSGKLCTARHNRVAAGFTTSRPSSSRPTFRCHGAEGHSAFSRTLPRSGHGRARITAREERGGSRRRDPGVCPVDGVYSEMRATISWELRTSRT